ncbi:InlB B-repeat-containing protein [Adlercreutzia sp. ZJ242]|uniref:InlB B-repeat-containing protein n=1 Tax=Adlercreutzia sp. ZJ242 TaxID=2709409 RepID=UPI0013ECBD81|nr:InlB B-repeat-containing protein [Adlercreutzia sp. ZJ242]
MFERIIDTRGTLEGKVLSVFLSVVLVLSMTNVFAFAEADANAGTTGEPQMGKAAVETSEEAGIDEEVGIGEAKVTFNLSNAYVEVRGQKLTGTDTVTLKVSDSADLVFKAIAENGYEVASVKAKNSAAANVPVTTQDGTYTIAAEYISNTLEVTVETELAELAEPAPAPDALTSDSDYSTEASADELEATEPEAADQPAVTDEGAESDEAAESEQPAPEVSGTEAPEGEEAEAAEPADAEATADAAAADEEVVTVYADVSSPAFEDWAYVGDVIVKVTAGEGVLPEGTTVQASRVERQDVIDAVSDKVEAQGKELQDAVAIDVTLLDKNGNAIQPDGAVNVCFFDANLEGEEVGVYRVSDDATKVEAIGTRQATTEVQSFDVDHFTIYVASGSGFQSYSGWGEQYQARPGETIRLYSDNYWLRSHEWSADGCNVQYEEEQGPMDEWRDYYSWADVTIPATASDKAEYVVTHGSGSYKEYFYIQVKEYCTVTFHPNGGTGDAVSVNTRGINITLPYVGTENGKINFTKEDHTFVGWSTDPFGKNDNYAAGALYPDNSAHKAVLKDDVTLYAIWLHNTEYANSANTVAYFYIKEDGEIPFEPGSYEKSGYIPRNSATDLKGSLRQPIAISNNIDAIRDNLKDVPTNEAILAALRKVDANNSFNPETQEIVWYAIKARDNAWNVDGVIRDKSKHFVHYDFNGGTGNATASQHAVGETVEVDFATSAMRPGYTFLGWSKDKGAVTPTYTEGGNKSFVMPDRDVTLYAVWQQNNAALYTVNYYLQNTDIKVVESKIGSKTIGLDVTEQAVDIDGYNLVTDDTTVGKDERGNTTYSKSITIDANEASNVINFYYTKRDDLTYTVKYYKDSVAEGNHVADADVLHEGAVFGTALTALDVETTIAEDKAPDGYKATGTVDTASSLETITTGANVVNVVLGKRDDLTYTVKYYKDSVAEGNHVADADVLHEGAVFGTALTALDVETTIAEDKAPDGYKATGTVDTASSLETITTGANVVNVVLGKREYLITASIDENGTIEGAAEQSVLYQNASAAVTLRANSGYRIASIVVDGASQIVENGMTEYTYGAIESVEDNHSVVVTTVALGAVSVEAPSVSKVYDGTPIAPSDAVFTGLPEGYTATADVSGSITEVGTAASTLSDVRIFDADGNDVTANFDITEIIGTLEVTPKAATVTVWDASKIAGAADPTFVGTVSGLVAEGDLGEITYSRLGDDEAVGTYPGTLTASYVENPNYNVTVVPGDFTIIAAPVPGPGTPGDTPDVPGGTTPGGTTPGGATPDGTTPGGTTPGATAPGAIIPAIPAPVTPAQIPGTVPDGAAAPVITPLVDALEGAAEAVIGDGQTPLADISDDATPLAERHVGCWVHFYIILGIVVTLVYAACVATRRALFSRRLKQYEDDLTGGDSPSGSPARRGVSWSPEAAAPAGATAVAMSGLGK